DFGDSRIIEISSSQPRRYRGNEPVQRGNYGFGCLSNLFVLLCDLARSHGHRRIPINAPGQFHEQHIPTIQPPATPLSMPDGIALATLNEVRHPRVIRAERYTR